MVTINYRDGRPIYEQVKDDLRRLVVTGAMQPGEKLPSVRELAVSLAINPNTIQRAYHELESEGYIVSVPGKGSFCAQFSPQSDPRREELLARLEETVRELRWLGVSEEEIIERSEATAMASIELKNVTKIYEGFKALDALNLTVPSGSVYGLIGPNGAGKTTAIRHMMGVLRQDAGSVLLDGEPVFENPTVKARMLCIPDEPYFTSTSTTRDLMKFTRALYPRFDTERYEKLREIFALDDTRPIRRLSRGMQKQSAFWIALAARPEVLVLDEPVDGLDPVMRRQVWSLVMEDVAEEGMTVLVSSHNLRELEDVCDHVGIMQRGRCLLEKSVSELQETTTKVLLALPDGTALPEEGLDILHRSSTGKLQTLILRGREEDNLAWLEKLHPLFMDSVPLTLEEIFIYELGGVDDAVRKNVL